MLAFFISLFMIICAIIGAGIATGKEIYEFFFRFGWVGLACIIFSMVVFGILFFKLIKTKEKYNITTFQQLNQKMFPKSNIVILILFNVSLIITSATMLSGINEIFFKISNISFPVFGILISIVLFFILEKGYKAMEKIIFPLSILLVILIITVCCFGINTADFSFISGNGKYSLLYALFFVGGNFMMIIEIAIAGTKKPFGWFIILFCVLSCIIFILIFLALLSTKTDVTAAMPLLELSFNINAALGYVYMINIGVAMITTLFTCAYTLNKNLENTITNNIVRNVSCILIIFIFSCFSFSSLVKFGYPIMGVIGLIFVLRLLFFDKIYFKSKRKPKILNIS